MPPHLLGSVRLSCFYFDMVLYVICDLFNQSFVCVLFAGAAFDGGTLLDGMLLRLRLDAFVYFTANRTHHSGGRALRVSPMLVSEIDHLQSLDRSVVRPQSLDRSPAVALFGSQRSADCFPRRASHLIIFPVGDPSEVQTHQRNDTILPISCVHLIQFI